MNIINCDPYANLIGIARETIVYIVMLAKSDNAGTNRRTISSMLLLCKLSYEVMTGNWKDIKMHHKGCLPDPIVSRLREYYSVNLPPHLKNIYNGKYNINISVGVYDEEKGKEYKECTVINGKIDERIRWDVYYLNSDNPIVKAVGPMVWYTPNKQQWRHQ